MEISIWVTHIFAVLPIAPLVWLVSGQRVNRNNFKNNIAFMKLHCADGPDNSATDFAKP